MTLTCVFVENWSDEKINIYFNSFSPQNNLYLKKINLAWNGFGLEGTIALGDALKNNQSLEELDLT
jgi:hypothetical protein